MGGGGGIMRLSGRDLGTFTVGGTDRITLEDGWRIAFRMTINNWMHFGHEIGYAYNRTKFRVNSNPVQEAGTAIHEGGYSFLAYALPQGKPVRPFVCGGGQFSNFIFPGQSVTQGGGATKFGYHYGGGIKARITDKILIRFDVRQYNTGKPFDFPNQSGRIKLLEASAGVSYYM